MYNQTKGESVLLRKMSGVPIVSLIGKHMNDPAPFILVS